MWLVARMEGLFVFESVGPITSCHSSACLTRFDRNLGGAEVFPTHGRP